MQYKYVVENTFAAKVHVRRMQNILDPQVFSFFFT